MKIIFMILFVTDWYTSIAIAIQAIAQTLTSANFLSNSFFII